MRGASPEKDSTRPTNLAARMARWSAHHRKKAIFGWLAFALVAFAIGNSVVKQKEIVSETPDPGSPAARTRFSTRTSSSRRVRAFSFRTRS